MHSITMRWGFVLAFLLLSEWTVGEVGIDIMDRKVCAPEGGAEGCSEPVKRWRRTDDALMKCVGFDAVTESMLGVAYSCPPEPASSKCVSSIDYTPLKLPEWLYAPIVYDVDVQMLRDPNSLVVVMFSENTEEGIKRLDAIGSTWMKRLDESIPIVLAGKKAVAVPKALADRKNLYVVRYHGPEDDLELTYAVYGDLQWRFQSHQFFLKVDDTTLVLSKNLERFIEVLGRIAPHQEPVIFGRGHCPFEDTPHSTLCIPYGVYGFSQEALQLLLSKMDMGCHRGVQDSPDGDLAVVKCFSEKSLAMVSCRNFRPHSPIAYLSAYPDDPNRALQVMRQKIMAEGPLGFQRLDSSAMLYMDGYLYGGSTASRIDEEMIMNVTRLITMRKDCTLSDDSRMKGMMVCSEPERYSKNVWKILG